MSVGGTPVDPSVQKCRDAQIINRLDGKTSFKVPSMRGHQGVRSLV